MSTSVLYDELGPRGRARVRAATIAVCVALALLTAEAIRRFAEHDQLDGERWSPFAQPEVVEFLLKGVWINIRLAVVAAVLAVTFGAILALSRLATSAAARMVGGTYVEVFRALPLLLLVFFSARGLDKVGIQVPAFWQMAVALVAYNSAVLAEIFRAGILSLERGQSEAAYAVGLTYNQAMRYVLVPQAVRRMLPALVSQLVTLLKDTSLAYVIPLQELLRSGERAGEEFGSLLQAYTIVAAMFIAMNFSLSRFAQRLERRQIRRYGAAPIAVAGVEDAASLTVAASEEADNPAGTARLHASQREKSS